MSAKWDKLLGILKKEDMEIELPLPSKKTGLSKRTAQLARAVTLAEEIDERLTTRRTETALEQLYLMDSLLFRDVHKLTELTVGGGYIIEKGSDQARMLIEKFINNLSRSFKRLLKCIVHDIFVYGNSYLELVRNGKGYVVDLALIDPKYMDFIREKGKVAIDELGFPVGYKYTGRRPFVEITRENVAHFKLFGLGDIDKGVSPLEPLYKPTIIRLNLEEATGEGGWRFSIPPIIVEIPEGETEEATATAIENMEKELKKSEPLVGLVVPEGYKIHVLDTKGTLDALTRLKEYYLILHCNAMGIPSGLRVKTDRATLEQQLRDMEMNILAYQNDLSDQIREQIFMRVLEPYGISKEDVPFIRLRSLSYMIQLYKARRLAILARHGLITHDKKLEEHLRELEELPPIFKDEPIIQEEVRS